MASNPSIPRVCESCGRTFLAVAAQVRIGRARFCSRRCRWPVTIEVSGDGLTARVPLLSQDGLIAAYALIDATDIDLVKHCRWSLTDDGYARGAIRVNGKRVKERMHRIILGLKRGDGFLGDHINRDRLDNRRQNLRPFPIQGRPDLQNRGRHATAGYRGVSFDRDSGKWRAYLRVQGKMRHLGRFNSEQEAADAARAARLALMPYATD